MAYDEALAARVRACLRDVAGITEKSPRPAGTSPRCRRSDR
jgi:hypothetical protein